MSKIIKSELQMAMIVATYYWRGTSMAEGALYFMEHVRLTHPDQFKEIVAAERLETARDAAALMESGRKG